MIIVLLAAILLSPFQETQEDTSSARAETNEELLLEMRQKLSLLNTLTREASNSLELSKGQIQQIRELYSEFGKRRQDLLDAEKPRQKLAEFDRMIEEILLPHQAQLFERLLDATRLTVGLKRLKDAIETPGEYGLTKAEAEQRKDVVKAIEKQLAQARDQYNAALSKIYREHAAQMKVREEQ